MTKANNFRLLIFKQQIEDKKLKSLYDLSDGELMNILDSAVLPNSLDSKAVRYSFLFHLLFCENEEKKERLLKQIERLRNLETQLTKTEKMIIKFGVIHRFTTYNYRVEFYRYLNNPISTKVFGSGRKFMSSVKFKQIFSFAHNLVRRGRNNERFPKH